MDNTPALQYAIELAAAGYDSADDTLQAGIVDKLERLREIQRRYRHPAVKLVRKVDLKFCDLLQEPRWHSNYWNEAWSDHGTVIVCRGNDHRSLGFLSTRPDIPLEDRFHSISFDFTFSRHQIDFTQDLVILYEQDTVHFRSLSTGKLHDTVRRLRNSSEGLRIRFTHGIETFSNHNTVVGDWLLLCSLCGGSPYRIYLYHWPSSELYKVSLECASANWLELTQYAIVRFGGSCKTRYFILSPAALLMALYSSCRSEEHTSNSSHSGESRMPSSA